MRLSVVIPCFNSPASLALQVSELQNVNYGLTDLEIVLVCDDESDYTWETVKNVAEIQNIRAVWLGRNVGQHLATLFGARLATNELIATIDDDGQYPVSAIQEMLMEISKGYDLVYGKPTQGKHGKARDFLSKSFKKISTQSRLIINADKISSQRVFKKQLISNLNDNLPNNFNFDILLLSRTTRVASIPVEIRERNSGVSNYSFNTLVKHSTNMLFSRVDVLSITMFRLGVLGLIISSLTSVVTFVRYFSGAITVPGYSSLILLLGLGLSIILIMQGIVGRMLSLLMNQVMGHRTLWVREELIPSKKEGTKN